MNTHTIIADPRQIEDLYNTLMWEIEPELTTELMPDLDYLYEKETPEEREARLEWYEAAYDMLLGRMSVFTSDCAGHLSAIKQKISMLARKDDAEKSGEQIADIERSLQNT